MVSRRSFLKGLAALTAAPFLPKAIPVAEEEVGWKVWEEYGAAVVDKKALQKGFPNLLVYLDGVVQNPSTTYTISKSTEGNFSVTFKEPVPDLSSVMVQVMPSSEDKIAYISELSTTGVKINELDAVIYDRGYDS